MTDEPSNPQVAEAPIGLAPLPLRLRDVLLLFGITLVAAVLRLSCLGEWSFWVDEAHTWRDVTMPMWRFVGDVRVWYPTSFLGLRALMDLGVLPGFSEGWLRLPFAFVGIVSVPVLALFGNAIVGRSAALLAAALLAVNPWHIYWSQNARAYVLVAFVALLACWTFWHGQQRRSWRWTTIGVLAALVCGSCHFSGLMLLPAFGAYWLLIRVRRHDRRMGIVLGAGAAVLLLGPHLVQLLPPFEAFRAQKAQPSLAHMVQTTAFYFRLPLLGAAGFGVWLALRRPIQGRLLFAACCAVLPLLGLAWLGGTIVKVTARYGICALPAVLLLASAAAVHVAAVARRALAPGVARGCAAAVLPLILGLDMVAYDYLYYTVQYGDRGRWREACEVVQAAAGNRPVLVCTSNEPTLLYYMRPNYHRGHEEATAERDATVYGIETQWVYGTGLPEHASWNGHTYFRGVTWTARQQGRELFVVASLPELAEKDRDGTLRQALREQFELVQLLPCWIGPKDASVYVWRVRAAR
ncbi:MAG: glycosyltransferase family 39 protein [Planctomycetota bacterium]